MKKWMITAVIAMFLTTSFAQQSKHVIKNGKKQKKMTKPVIADLNVTSTAFANNGIIPLKYTCAGQHISPPLVITKIPSGAKSLALIVYDYKFTPHSGFTFWIVWNIEVSGNISEGYASSYQTMNAAKRYGYTPICADEGTHKYHFIVYALDCDLLLDEHTTKEII